MAVRRTGARHTKKDRGVTLVEYVLFVSGFVLVAVTAVGGLNSTARSYFQQSSSKIGQPVNRIAYDRNGNRQQQASTTTITAPPSTTTTTIAPTTTAAPTTTTIAPTTTRATTTTAAPTTTVPPTTTTTAAPRVVYGTIGEGGTLTLTAPGATTVKFLTVSFASYGTPTSTYPYSTGSCNASTSTSVVTTAFVGKHTYTITADNNTFGDPCVGTYKSLSVVLTY